MARAMMSIAVLLLLAASVAAAENCEAPEGPALIQATKHRRATARSSPHEVGAIVYNVEKGISRTKNLPATGGFFKLDENCDGEISREELGDNKLGGEIWEALGKEPIGFMKFAGAKECAPLFDWDEKSLTKLDEEIQMVLRGATGDEEMNSSGGECQQIRSKILSFQEKGVGDLKLAAEYIIGWMTREEDPVDFVSIPEATVELMYYIHGELESRAQIEGGEPRELEEIGVLYELVISAYGTANVDTGLAMLYKKGKYDLEARTKCFTVPGAKRPSESPHYAADIPGFDRERRGRYEKWLDRSCALGLQVNEPSIILAVNEFVTRPLIAARFAVNPSNAGVSKFVAASMHGGHFTHMVGKPDKDGVSGPSDIEQINMAIDLVNEGSDTPFMIFGDMNTHFGISRSEPEVTAMLNALPDNQFSKGKTAAQMTFNLPAIDAEAQKRNYRVLDTKHDEVDEFVSCCCPRGTPWSPRGQPAPSMDCGGTVGETTSTQSWVEAFDMSVPLCAMKQEEYGLPERKPGNDILNPRCMGSNGMTDEDFEQYKQHVSEGGYVMQDGVDYKTRVDNGEEPGPDNFLAEFMFDHIIVGHHMSTHRLVKQRYEMLQLHDGMSDHFPVHSRFALEQVE